MRESQVFATLFICSISFFGFWESSLAGAVLEEVESLDADSGRLSEVMLGKGLVTAGGHLKEASIMSFSQLGVNSLGLFPIGLYFTGKAYQSIGSSGRELSETGNRLMEIPNQYDFLAKPLQAGGDCLQRAKKMGYIGTGLYLAGIASLATAAHFSDDNETIALLAASGALGAMSGGLVCSLLADGYIGKAGDVLFEMKQPVSYSSPFYLDLGSNLRVYKKVQYVGKGLLLAGGMLIYTGFATYSEDDTALFGKLILGGVGAILGGVGCSIAAPFFLLRAGDHMARVGTMIGIAHQD